MAEEIKHPWLNLPDDKLAETLRKLNLAQIVDFSLFSEECKNAVKSLKIQGTRITVAVHHKVNVCFEFKESWCTLFFQPENSTNVEERKLNASLKVEILAPGSMSKGIRKDQFGIEDWMKHFYTIFNFRSIDSIKFSVLSKNYDPVDIKKYFGVPFTLDVTHTRDYARNQIILQTFFPVESLHIDPEAFEDSKIPPEILMQNFTTLRTSSAFNPKLVTFNDLLMMNSKSIVILRTRMGPKDINRFIKLWQHGANPQMEYLYIECKVIGKEDQETVLNGIKCTAMPSSERRLFSFADHRNQEEVNGGMDIWRKDGVKATIHFDVRDARGWIEIFVWFDHCIV